MYYLNFCIYFNFVSEYVIDIGESFMSFLGQSYPLQVLVFLLLPSVELDL